ncbi:uncharacterized protein LOC114712530 [Neltuma alba]|uniref:uncharacterized protein LOC114712530 n=1 Tax=Neltuma alba TaxID=207710 RepID=UPI0010A34B33|nr:uncharacterized protein LOC114712530 [Prosopis alba]
MKLYYTVVDETGSASVIFWNKLAVQLVKHTASELKLMLEKQEDRAYDFPNKLDDPVGVKVLLKLKLNEYNKKYPHSSISVLQYTICENLIEQFDDVVDENVVNVEDESAEVQHYEPIPPSQPDPQTPIPDAPKLDDITLAKLCQNVAVPSIVTRKRKSGGKNSSVAADKVNGLGSSSASDPNWNTVKIIKKEKDA